MVFLFASQAVFSAKAQEVQSVQVTATVTKTPPTIVLNWKPESTATSYYVSRRAAGTATWGNPVTVNAVANRYADTAVTVGTIYEYRIQRLAAGYTGYGFIWAAIEAPLVESRGKLILVVDNTQSEPLAAELTRLTKDLTGDGWTVLRRDVARIASVASIRALIKADYTADPANVKAVFLFGHVPVPYSGNLYPDGHPDHRGAWPADLIYGDMDGVYTDTSAIATASGRLENRNAIGDGKYDQSKVPFVGSLADVELQVGRVDLANLPIFAKSETELLRQYLDKDHRYRCKEMAVEARGLIDDHFGMATGEPFAANGYRNFAPLLGSDKTFALDWTTTLSASGYLWAYGCGGGYYLGAAGVVDSGNFSLGNYQAVFTMLFGSYFGDWDSQNNLLRSAIASGDYGLTCVWAGRPHWFFHPMGLGQTIGYCARLTQSNTGQYLGGSGVSGIHVALMGDPTLRMHTITPPTNFYVARRAGGGANLTWTPSTEAVGGYHVYSASSPAGPFTRLTSSLLTQPGYAATADPAGKTYMVRAVKLETTPSGSFFNASTGIFCALTDAPSVKVNAIDANAAKLGSDPGTVLISRTGVTALPLTIPLIITGTATNGVDFAAIASTVTIPAGAVSQEVTITPTNNASPEGATEVVVALGPSANFIAGTPSAAAVQIAPLPADAWLFASFTAEQLNDFEVSSLAADPDRDGISNLLEYAFLLSPNLPDSQGMPASSINTAAGEDFLAISFRRNKSATDVTFTVEAASSPEGPWSSGESVTEQVGAEALGNGADWVTVRDKLPIASAASRYLRVKIDRVQ